MTSYGIIIPQRASMFGVGTLRELLDLAPIAEQSGFFDAAWVGDSLTSKARPDAMACLGLLAGTTSTLRLAVGCMASFPVRDPALFAYQWASLDAVSNGRALLAVCNGLQKREGASELEGKHFGGVPDKQRVARLEEYLSLLRELWTGEQVSHDGDHYIVENARLYSLPEAPPPVLVSGFGPKATRLAARIGEGYCNVQPDADMAELYRSEGGTGPLQMGMKVCVGSDRDACLDTVLERWPNEALGGELPVLLPTPAHFKQATELVTKEIMAEQVPCGPDAQPIIEAIQEGLDAGYEEIYVNQIGDDFGPFESIMRDEVLPHFA